MEKNTKKERVQKIISEAGYCSRRQAEDLIEKGKVTVNGILITIGDKASAKDVIKISGRKLTKAKKVYIMLNKPKGYITTNSDLYDRKKVIDLIDIPERVYPVGRLDRDATGLLLLTNDGDWSNSIMHPRYGKEKEYLVETSDRLDKETVALMNRGFKLKDGYIKPYVRMIKVNYFSGTIHEGRNKIVKRIFNHFDVRVKQLKRVRIGKYKLGKLKPGEWKFMEPENELSIHKQRRRAKKTM